MKRFGYWPGGLILAALCISVCSVSVYAEDEEKVRIGLYNKDDYHIIDDHSRHSGYDHEFILEIAKYTGWEYEMVEGTWQECISMLKNGEIDLLGGVGMNEEWDSIHYAAEPSAYSSNCLLISDKSMAYAYEDFEAFDGMRIGILVDSTIDLDLQTYGEEHDFRYTLVQFETEEALNEALQAGKIDCAGLSDFRNLGMYKIIARISDKPLYYATSPGRPDLKEELDDALQKIHQQNKFYEAQLYDKYFNSAHHIAFSKEEMEYLKEHDTIQVALFPDIPQVCEYDEASGEYVGFIFQIFDLLSEETGISFEYSIVPEDEFPWDFLYEHPNVLLAPLFQNDLIHYSERMRFQDTIVPGKMIAVTNGKPVLDVINTGGTFKLAIPKGMFGASQELQSLFPSCEIVLCDSHQDGMDMVRQGRADMTIVNEILGSYLMQSPYYSDLKPVYLNHVMENLTIGMGSSSDVMLMSILNKVIQSFSQSDIQQLVMEYTAKHPYQKDMKELLYEYWGILLLVLFVLLVSAVLWWIYKKQRKAWTEQAVQLKIAEEKLKTEEKYKKELFRQANFDELTGLYNSRYFLAKANEMVREHPDVVYTFFHINLTNFKLINEIYGIACGDAVLLEIAKQLKEQAGGRGIYGRLYGDQFVLCYPLEQKYLDELSQYPTLFYVKAGDKQIRVQSQVGVYTDSQHIENAVQAITYARIALQNQETANGNHIHVYREDYLNRMLMNQALTNEMEQALAEQQFQVYLQPQYDILSKCLVSAEALVRWVHPTRGMIPPNDFIPLFEMNGFITRLDMFMLEQVCGLMAKWRKQGKLIPVSVNLSRINLQDKQLCLKIQAILEQYGIPPEYLHLELTESAYVEQKGACYHMIEELRQAGFVIEMDDFGSGYSSLNMLKDIPVDVLKLDMRFFSEETNMDKGGGISLRQSSIWRICWESWWWLKAWKQSGKRISCCRFSAASYRDICTAVPCRWMHLKRFWRSVLWEIR